MEFRITEEISPKPFIEFKVELRDLVADEAFFVFPPTNERAIRQASSINSVHYLRKIYMLFACNYISSN